jgi:hypothetical protein
MIDAMNSQNRKNGVMRPAARFQFPVLAPDKRRDEKVFARQMLHPATKFGQVLFVYRLADVKDEGVEVDRDDARIIAVLP